MNGQIVILNGAPRSGKSSIARVIQDTFDGVWMNLGVDAFVREVTPSRLRPGIGLRPCGERPDLEAHLPALYFALYDSSAAHSRQGLNVVADFGHHDAYSAPLGILGHCARRMTALPVLFVGVRCSLEAIMERRNLGEPGREHDYAQGTAEDPAPAAVAAWQDAVHAHSLYDLEVDTSDTSPEACAAAIRVRLDEGASTFKAFRELALR